MDSTCWRKSSYSGGQGGNCVEVGSGRRPTPGGSRAERRDQASVVLVRDTRYRDDKQLTVGAAAWRAFTGALR